MATAVFWQHGEALDYLNSGSGKIDANTIMVFGKRVGVIGGDIDPGQLGSLIVKGVFKLPKAASTAITAGALVYWDDTNAVITTTSSGNTPAGYAAAEAAADAETVLVNLNA